MARRKKTVEKLSLSDLMGEEKRPNADIHKEDEQKQHWHKKYRTPRHRLMPLQGDGYTRPLASDPQRDMKYNELCREFVNNGLKQTKAYAAVYGVSLKSASRLAPAIFASAGIKAKIREYMLGTDGEFDDLPKSYLIERLMLMIDNNILDYIANDGTWLSIEELKALPEWAQQQIKRLSIKNEHIPVAVRDADGAYVKDENNETVYVDVRNQHVTIELYDKQKAMEHLGKAMQWITTNTEVNVSLINADTMVQAESRVKKLRREDIEGQAKHVTSD